jgi:hypothetical protein
MGTSIPAGGCTSLLYGIAEPELVLAPERDRQELLASAELTMLEPDTSREA